MADLVEPPGKKAIDLQLRSVRFLAGVDAGRWAILEFAWPHLYVRAVGCDYGTGFTFSHDFRLECSGFPDPGPLVERWAFAAEPSHGSLPPPPAVGSPGFIDAMKDWQPGGIYRAWSRNAAVHNNWAAKRPDEAWHPRREITFIMEHLYALVSEQAVWLAGRA